MGWDESFFRGVLRVTERLFSRTPPSPYYEARVALSEILPRLTFLARALTGEAIEIREAEREGGYSGNILFLPGEMDLYPDRATNAKAYLYRTAYSCFSRKEGFGVPEATTPDARLELSLATVDETAKAMERELPATAELRRELAVAPATADKIKLFGLLQSFRWESPAAAAKPSQEIPASALAQGTERKGKPRESVELIELGEDKLDENPLAHVFEKVRTAEEYEAGKKSFDGSDELAEHAEALEELNLRKVIRSRERTRSLLRSDALIESGAPDLEDEIGPGGSAFLYDEWAGKSYRKDWCSVFMREPERRLSDEAAALWSTEILRAHRAQVEALKRRLSTLLSERKWRNRQLEGSEIDLEAVVDRYATLKSGHSPSEKLYLRRRRQEADFATLILLDGSLSTDSWVGNRRVMDVARESVLILGEVLEGIHDQVAVASFHSNTRRDCRYQLLKGFDEKWRKCGTRLASLEPAGYTRIGPALRHSSALLERTHARKKLLLLISDGKPTDYDRYEGRYGIADVRQAMREAAGKKIRIRTLAIDAQAKLYLPQMFGAGNFEILPHPGELTLALARIYGEIVRS